MKKIIAKALVILGGIACTHIAAAQTKQFEIGNGAIRLFANAENTNSYNIIWGNYDDWGLEYFMGGLNFYSRFNGDYQLFLKDNGNIGIGTNTPTEKLQVNGKIRCHQTYSTVYYTLSDKRAKEDIKPIEPTIAKLKKLNGVSYHYKKTALKSFGDSLDSDKLHLGLIAQDVQIDFPELVQEIDSTGTLAIDYIGLIPVLVEAIKEQQDQITSLKVQAMASTELMLRLETLEKQLAKCCPQNNASGKGKLKSGATDTETSNSGTSTSLVLYQNNPNPFSASTEIAMELPNNVQDARLAVYNLAGEQKLSISVAERGAASVRIEAGQLHPGIYIYGIIVDGQLAVSKQMVVTE